MTRQIISLTLVAALLSGCGTVHTERVAKFKPGTGIKTVRVTEPGAYQVHWKQRSSDKLHVVRETARFLRKDQTVGFEQRPDGTIIAIAGDERIPLPAPPRKAVYCMWYTKWDEPTALTNGTAAAIKGAGNVAAVGALVGVAAVLAVAEADTSNDDDDTCANTTGR